MKTAILLVIISINYSFAAESSCDKVFQENNGLLIIEAENVRLFSNWEKQNSINDYNGSGYINWTGSNNLTFQKIATLMYKFKIENPGTYNIKLRNIHMHEDHTKENDHFTKIDSGHWHKTLSSINKSWNTQTKYEKADGEIDKIYQIYFEKGEHTFEISPRSTGFMVDRIILHKDDVATSKLSSPESETICNVGLNDQNDHVILTGNREVWDKISFYVKGPSAHELDTNPNPFLDYRLNMILTSPSNKQFVVPGYFDGNGNGYEEGNIWKVNFTPDEVGNWKYTTLFRSGSEIAISFDDNNSSKLTADGTAGSFYVNKTLETATGFYKKGRLVYANSFYLKTLGDNKYWIKGGTDTPENYLGYTGFDNTSGREDKSWFHTFSEHEKHWEAGDPDWRNGRGKAIIGSLNYLNEKNVNSIYFLPMNIGGDGQDVWPYSGFITRAGHDSNDNLHFDISKLNQWEFFFEHAQRKGINLNIVLNEGEEKNKLELDDTALGIERKLFYREMVARFGHHNAIQWMMSEEYNHNDYSVPPDTVKSWANYIKQIDPYNHPVSVHNMN